MGALQLVFCCCLSGNTLQKADWLDVSTHHPTTPSIRSTTPPLYCLSSLSSFRSTTLTDSSQYRTYISVQVTPLSGAVSGDIKGGSGVSGMVMGENRCDQNNKSSELLAHTNFLYGLVWGISINLFFVALEQALVIGTSTFAPNENRQYATKYCTSRVSCVSALREAQGWVGEWEQCAPRLL